jgi:hypothetical protein
VLDVSSPSDLEAVERNGADLLYIFDDYISGTLLPSFHPLVGDRLAGCEESYARMGLIEGTPRQRTAEETDIAASQIEAEEGKGEIFLPALAFRQAPW